MRNFNDNAAAAGRTGSKSSAYEDVNRNWNAGDADAEEPPVGQVGEGVVTRKSETSAPPRKSEPTAPPESGHKDNDAETAVDVGEEEEEAQLSEAESKIARLRRLSTLHGDDGAERREPTKEKKRKVSRPQRICVRRCIAEDPTWDLKTVPDLDMLVVKYFADDYAGTSVTLDLQIQIQKISVGRPPPPTIRME